ncbi:gamma-glutamylcyclotransferase family protein [Roseiconus lacunae]|uniref:gamma-glutamylcyclotransferase family protein n=1 Tax=Roseiconus lacunae TaxID=2605694 RepID=UPI00308CB64A|nr:gamma-glutamylcyclotransferase family protein [Stieleria sp. HD01]
METERRQVNSFFVYGTLKRGQCREKLWPAEPSSVHPAWVVATLYGRHDYPAMTRGDSRVIGEVWTFSDSELPLVMCVLDEIEGTDGNGPSDLYHRYVVEATLLSGNLQHDRDNSDCVKAYAYFYNNDPVKDGFHVQPIDKGRQAWPG